MVKILKKDMEATDVVHIVIMLLEVKCNEGHHTEVKLRKHD